jgi:ABC-2 type transport system permease protein
VTGPAAIASRELASYFRTPAGWVVAALFVALSAVVFAFGVLHPGEPASLRPFFNAAHWVLLVVAPAISMRLVAEERRSGTLDLLSAAPVSEWAVAWGKYLAAVAFLAILLAPTLVFVGVLAAVASPDYGAIAAGYAGLMLVGALYLAVGLLFSTASSSQVVAFLSTFFFFLALWFLSGTLAALLGGAWARVLYELSIGLRIADFAKGVIDLEHVAFFLASACWFVCASALLLETRRWR